MVSAALALWGFRATLLLGAPTVEEILEIERSIVDARRSIRSGRVVLNVRLNIHSTHPELAGTSKRYDILFDGEKIRADCSATAGGVVHLSQEVWTPAHFIRASSSSQVVQLFGRHTRPESSAAIPDPRLLGFVPWFVDTFNQFGYESCFLNPSRKDIVCESIVIDGRERWKVTCTSLRPVGDVRNEYWLAPEAGQLPVMIEEKYMAGKLDVVQRIDVELDEYSDGKVGFPRNVVFRQWLGDVLHVEEVADVGTAEFGLELDDDRFNIGGIGLSTGRIVDDDGNIMRWNGRALVPTAFHESSDDGEAIVRAAGQAETVRWLWITNALVLAVLAVLLVRGVIRQNRGPSSKG